MSMFDEGISVAFRKGLQSMQNAKYQFSIFIRLNSFHHYRPSLLLLIMPFWNVLDATVLSGNWLLLMLLLYRFLIV